MGTDIVVDTYKLDNYAKRLNRVCMRISDINSQLESLYWSVCENEDLISEAYNIQSILNSDILQRGRSTLNKGSHYLSNTAIDFKVAEQNVIKASNSMNGSVFANMHSLSILDKSVADAKNESSDSESDSFKDVFLDFLEEAGHFGSVVSLAKGITDIVKGGGPEKLIKTAWSTYKSTADFVEDIKNMGKAKRILHPDTVKNVWKDKILGLRDYFKDKKIIASKASSGSTRYYNNYQKVFAKKNKLTTVVWIDVAVSGVVNAFENKEEYESGEISAGRAVSETLCETALDVGVDLALTATAAAAIGAAFGAAPVLAVGGAVVLGKMALDGITKWATNGEKDFTESVSDLVLDGAEAIGKGIADGINKVGDCISSTWDKIKPKWKLSFGF